jgi:hypothetical protein
MLSPSRPTCLDATPGVGRCECAGSHVRSRAGRRNRDGAAIVVVAGRFFRHIEVLWPEMSADELRGLERSAETLKNALRRFTGSS